MTLRTHLLSGFSFVLSLSMSVAVAMYLAEIILPSGNQASLDHLRPARPGEDIRDNSSSQASLHDDARPSEEFVRRPADPTVGEADNAVVVAGKAPAPDMYSNPQQPEAKSTADAVGTAARMVSGMTGNLDEKQNGSALTAVAPMAVSVAPSAPLQPSVGEQADGTSTGRPIASGAGEETATAFPRAAIALAGLPAETIVGTAGGAAAVTDDPPYIETTAAPLSLPRPTAMLRVTNLTDIALQEARAPELPATEIGVIRSLLPPLASELPAGDTAPRAPNSVEIRHPKVHISAILPKGLFAISSNDERPEGRHVPAPIDIGLQDILMPSEISQSPHHLNLARRMRAGTAQLAVLNVEMPPSQVEPSAPIPKAVLPTSGAESVSDIQVVKGSEMNGTEHESESTSHYETSQSTPAGPPEATGKIGAAPEPVADREIAETPDGNASDPDAALMRTAAIRTSIRPVARPNRTTNVMPQPEPPASDRNVPTELHSPVAAIAPKKPLTAATGGASAVVVGVFDLGHESWVLVRYARGDIRELRVDDSIAGVRVRAIRGKVVQVEDHGRIRTLGIGDLIGP